MSNFFVSKKDPNVVINLNNVDYTFETDDGAIVINVIGSEPFTVSYDVGTELINYIKQGAK